MRNRQYRTLRVSAFQRFKSREGAGAGWEPCRGAAGGAADRGLPLALRQPRHRVLQTCLHLKRFIYVVKLSAAE